MGRRIDELIGKFFSGELTEAERIELNEWLSDPDKKESLLGKAMREKKIGKELHEMYKIDEESGWDKLMQQIPALQDEQYEPEQTPVVPIFSKKPWWKTNIAAAAILVLIAAGTWMILEYRASTNREVASVEPEKKIRNDIDPGGNKALLQLADGSTIVLDSSATGTLTTQGGTHVKKTGAGQVVYDAAAAANETKVVYNTISTPRGGQYQVVLPDGSRVWLNAASSLRYPTAFKGKERRVELTGEAYFEIEKKLGADKHRLPFIVTIRSASGVESGEVEVLGTHFNVMAYDNEKTVNTTLLEGSVRMKKGTVSDVLQPGEQARLSRNGELKKVKVDLEEEIAWKNGIFLFKGTPIETVLHQASRWYNVEVEYRVNIENNHLVATIPRDVTLSKFLEIMELMGDMHFRIEGSKIIVLP